MGEVIRFPQQTVTAADVIGDGSGAAVFEEFVASVSLPTPVEHEPFYIEEHVDEDVLMEFSDVAAQIGLLYEAGSAADLGARLRTIKRLVGDWPG